MKLYDYLIIGQGLAGSVLAWKLIKAGKKIRVVSNAAYKPASMVAAGMFNPLVFKRITKSWKIDELLPELTGFFTEVENETQKKIIDFKNIVKPINEFEEKQWIGKFENPDFKNYIVSFDKNKKMDGVKNFHSFVTIKGGGRVNLELFLSLIKDRLMRADSFSQEAFEYSDLQVNTDYFGWKEIMAKKIVFCEGPYAVNNPFFNKVGYYLTKGDVLLIRSEQLTEEFILSKQIFILPVGNHMYLSGSTYNWSDVQFNPQPLESDKQLLVKKIQEILHVDFEVLDHRCGIRPTVKDRRPVLGSHADISNMFYFNGLGTKGVMLAPYFANEMIAFMEDRIPVNKEVQIDRFYS